MVTDFTIDLGTVAHTSDGHAYVYYGRALSTVGTWSHHFIREHPDRTWPVFRPWFYHAVDLNTLLRKFPDLVVKRNTE